MRLFQSVSEELDLASLLKPHELKNLGFAPIHKNLSHTGLEKAKGLSHLGFVCAAIL